MKFRIQVGRSDDNKHWEEYDEDTDDAQKWAEDIIKYFNRTGQPGDPQRYLFAVEVLDPDTIPEHDWHKQNIMTLTSPQGLYDKIKCGRCGVHARRYGLTRVVRQHPYRAKKFERCDTALRARLDRS